MHKTVVSNLKYYLTTINLLKENICKRYLQLYETLRIRMTISCLTNIFMNYFWVLALFISFINEISLFVVLLLDYCFISCRFVYWFVVFLIFLFCLQKIFSITTLEFLKIQDKNKLKNSKKSTLLFFLLNGYYF